MNIKNFILFIFYQLVFLNVSFGQIWPKIINIGNPSLPYSVIQTYDNGYIIGGQLLNWDGTLSDGYFYKITINGEVLWYKRLIGSQEWVGVFDLNQTSDGGNIISGSTDEYDSWGDPIIIKMNPCNETEWCRVYSIGEERFDMATSIEQIPGGYIAYVFYGYDLWSSNKVHLYRLDENGDMVWQQLYGQSDSSMIGADGNDMKVTQDFHFLISGFCYFPDSGSAGTKYLRPMIIKVDSLGNAEWELPWSYVAGENFHGMAERSVQDDKKTLYTCGRHIESSATPPGDRPTMLKTDSSGNELAYFDLIPDTWQANFFNINWFQDSTLEIDGGWIYTPGGAGQIGVLKVDRNGNLLDSVNLMSTVYCFSDAIVDTDNKVFLVQPLYENNQWNTYAWKLNSDLEYDTLYTRPMVYDSLCPYPIVSDTIPLDCEVVGLNEPFTDPETGRLKAYPNPAGDILHLVIPEKLKAESSNPAFSVTTIFHQWRSATVEVYDLFGRRVYAKEIRPGDRELSIGVAAWPAGMYIVRLVYQGRTVGSEKVVVE